MTKPTLVTTRRIYDHVLASLQQTFDVVADNQATDTPWTLEEMRARVANADYVLCSVADKMDASVIAAAARVKVIATGAVGYNNIDIAACLEHHRSHGCLATMTAVQPPGRYGSLALQEQAEHSEVLSFEEKPTGGDRGTWINAGFFVLEPAVLELIDGDATTWEFEPLRQLAACGQLQAWRHHGFWRVIDTQRDRQQLEELWAAGRAPWKLW